MQSQSLVVDSLDKSQNNYNNTNQYVAGDDWAELQKLDLEKYEEEKRKEKEEIMKKKMAIKETLMLQIQERNMQK